MTDPNNLNLPLPPRRPMPPEVHDRLRTTVLRGLATPRSRLDRARPPLAVAASVAVLAAGAAIVAQSVGNSNQDTPVSPTSTYPTVSRPVAPPLDPVAAAADMDRCWAAVQRADKAAVVPARTTWEAVFAVSNSGRTVTAVLAGGRPLFCETTLTTVTVSDPGVAPQYAKDSRTAAMLISKDGAVGGVVDPDWHSMAFLSVSREGASSSAPSIIKNGMFVDFSSFATGSGARFTVRQTVADESLTPPMVPPGGTSTQPKPGEPAPGQSHAELDLPLPPPPVVSMTDRPATNVDRSSDAGRFLGECIAKSDTAVVDPESWQPVAVGGTSPNREVLALSGDQVGHCSSSVAFRDINDQGTPTYQFAWAPPEAIRRGEPIQYLAPPIGWGPQDQHTVLGLLRNDVASVELRGTGDARIPVILGNGGFSATVSGVGWEDLSTITAVVRDASGAELYRGPVIG